MDRHEDREATRRIDAFIGELAESGIARRMQSLAGLRKIGQALRFLHLPIFPQEAMAIARVTVAIRHPHVPPTLRNDLRRVLDAGVKELLPRVAPPRVRGAYIEIAAEELDAINPLRREVRNLLKNDGTAEAVQRFVKERLPHREVAVVDIQRIMNRSDRNFAKARAIVSAPFHCDWSTLEKKMRQAKRRMDVARMMRDEE